MGLSSSYKLMKNSIVAFVAKYVPVSDQSGPPPFPPIIGTGFVVHEDGLIATNAHVVTAFRDIQGPLDATRKEWPAGCILLRPRGLGMVGIPLEIIGAISLTQVIPRGVPYYGPPNGPDLAFIQVNARGLPAVRLYGGEAIEEGTEVATAGFPMGIDALMSPGWMHQMTPTLQRGIVSAVLPFPGPTPHAYAVNLMVQGGASGSPVFLSDSGDVVGVLYANLNDTRVAFRRTEGEPEQFPYTVPTNISYVVPSHYLRAALEQIPKQIPEVAAGLNDAKTIDEIIAAIELNDGAEPKFAQWTLKEANFPSSKM